MKKVLIITYYWPPSGGAGVQRWVKFSKYLRLYGYEPIVLTVNPEVASYPILDKSLEKEVQNIKVYRTNTFEPFNLYKKLLGKTEIPYSGFANETNPGIFDKISRFLRGNLFIPDARVGWNKYALRVARELIKKYKIENLITSSPPHSTQLIGLKLSKEFRLNWIADLRDPWTDIYYYKELLHTKFAKRYDKKMELEVLSKADKVVVVSSSIKQTFQKKIKNNGSEKIIVVPNGFDEEDFKTINKVRNISFTIGYIGTLADSYNVENLISVLEKFKDKNIELKFVGKVTDSLKEMIRRRGLTSVTSFLNHVEHQEAVQYMCSSDLLLLAIPDMKNNEGILTGKLFEYLATGNPILGIGPPDGDAAKIISSCNAGVMFDYDDEYVKMFNYLNDCYNNWEKGVISSAEVKCLDYSRKELTRQISELLF